MAGLSSAMTRRHSDGAQLQRLAALGRVDYDRERDGAADRMGIRRATLDAEVEQRRSRSSEGRQGDSDALRADIEPWPDPVDGAALLNDLAALFLKFLALPTSTAEVLALWTVDAHAHDAAQISPILAFVSPEKRCGKTTALSVLQGLVPRALPAANITAAGRDH